MRIILLAAIGMAVYLKYDTVVNSNAFRNLRQPRRLVDAMLHKGQAPAAAPLPVPGIVWALDSALVQADCPDGRNEACLDAWQSLDKEAIGSLRAALEKAGAQWNADSGTGFKATFRRIPDALDPLANAGTLLQLSRLEIGGSKGPLVLERAPGPGPSPLCAHDRCLDAVHPNAPFSRFRNAGNNRAADPGSRVPEASLTSLSGLAAKPILRGRLVEAAAEMAPDRWVKIYHGGNTFSWYRGFATLRPGLKPGSMIETGDTLGLVAAKGDTLGTLDIRIEKDGMMVDPFTFLGLQSDSIGTEYAR
ncbi:MAG: hypothetical protein JWP91_2207 [Fibrobacteres bacterium]|nr:hypothetical protein [Fibrobacterota bacterium]